MLYLFKVKMQNFKRVRFLCYCYKNSKIYSLEQPAPLFRSHFTLRPYNSCYARRSRKPCVPTDWLGVLQKSGVCVFQYLQAKQGLWQCKIWPEKRCKVLSKISGERGCVVSWWRARCIKLLSGWLSSSVGVRKKIARVW